MSSATNTSFIGHLGRLGFTLDDDKSAGGASAQAGATALLSAASRVTVAAANGSMILKSILGRDAPNVCFVINDSGQTIQVYPFVGENQNGVANAALAIADGKFAIFSRVQATNDWRSAVVT